MAEYISQGVFRLMDTVKIESFASVVSSKEGKGPLGAYFDKVVEDSHFGEDSWEKAESHFQLEAVSHAIRKANLTIENISYDKSLGLIKLNSKTLNFDQIVSVDIIANSKKAKASELSKISNVKKLEIKIGTQVKKVVYRHFKYITGKISEKNKKIAVKSCLKDYKKLKKVLKNVKFD